MEISGLSFASRVQKELAGEDIVSSGLPSFQRLLKTERNPGTVRSVLVAHVLHTAIEFIEGINSVYPVEEVVAVPYSADLAAIEILRDRGFKVTLPDTVEETFSLAESATIAALQKSSLPLIVQEVGGYLAKVTDRLASFENFLGVVEDTNNGHWRYENNEPHSIPIVSMAQSPLKDVEDTIIGDAVIYSVERIFREEFDSILQGVRAGVVGFGKIGTSSAIALKGRESVVSIYDINPAKNMRAKVEGFNPLPLHQLLSTCDLVIGATGQTSIRLVDMAHIKSGSILVSASSKKIEFALEDFANECVSVDRVNSITEKYTRSDGGFFYVLNSGAPINFRDKSILGTILDMIYSELFLCMRELVHGNFVDGLHHSPPRIQNEVSKSWLQSHSVLFSSDIDDKVWDYPDSLELGRPK